MHSRFKGRVVDKTGLIFMFSYLEKQSYHTSTNLKAVVWFLKNCRSVNVYYSLGFKVAALFAVWRQKNSLSLIIEGLLIASLQ